MAVGLLVVATGPAAAAPGTLTTTVPATFEFRSVDYQVNGVPSCGSATFVRWAAVPDAISATAAFRFRSAGAADRGEPFDDMEKARAAGANPASRFDNTYVFGGSYRVESGYDWLNINQVAGGSATCETGAARQPRMVDASAGVRLTLTIAVSAPVVTATRGVHVLSMPRRATVGSVGCPARGACTIRTPRTATVRIKGTRYRLAVSAPARIGAGRRAEVRVTFPPAAAAALAGSRVRPAVRVTATNRGVATTTATVARWVRR